MVEVTLPNYMVNDKHLGHCITFDGRYGDIMLISGLGIHLMMHDTDKVFIYNRHKITLVYGVAQSTCEIKTA